MTASEKKGRNQQSEPRQCDDVERIHTMNGFFVASQPQPKDFKQAKNGATETGTFEEPIGPAARQGVNVVYQIKTDAWKKDVAAGLHYLDKLARVYVQLGIGPKDREIVGVFHGDAGYFLLKDPAFQKATEKSGKNPNKQSVKDLVDAGVRLELCKSTMKNHGWTGDDVLPGVRIVVGAYPRIIDLQLRGYAYIRF